MYDKLIENYVNKLTVNDIIYFAKKENFNISLNDANTVLFYIKNYWKVIYKGNPTPIFNDFKRKVNISTYQKAIDLYNKYKGMIK